MKNKDNRLLPNYKRIAPRDLFNEAKLLKCMGQLTLMILDGKIPVPMECEFSGNPFLINALLDGSITITNFEVKIKGVSVRFKSMLNDKSSYPLLVEDGNEDVRVFNDTGEFTEEFFEFCHRI